MTDNEKPILLPCAHCGRPVTLEFQVMDDDNKYPRPHWHACIECDCGIKLGWWTISKQLPDSHNYINRTQIVPEMVNDIVSTWNKRA